MCSISQNCPRTKHLWEEKSRQSQDLNPRQLGEKRNCYLCAMPPPTHPSNWRKSYIFLGKRNFVDLFWCHLDVKGRLINSISTSCPPRQDQMIVRQTLGDLLSDGTAFLISFKIPAIRWEPPPPSAQWPPWRKKLEKDSLWVCLFFCLNSNYLLLANKLNKGMHIFTK